MRRDRDGTATGARSRVQPFVAVRGVVYAAGFAALWAWIAAGARSYDARWPFELPGWLRPVGWVLAAGGAALAAACVATFVVRGRGTPLPLDPPREFVASGPYRWVRNPMYVGAGAVLLGAGLALSSPSISALAFGFLALMHLIVVLYEEPTLKATFGASYERYRSGVNRWIVRPPRGGGEA